MITRHPRPGYGYGVIRVDMVLFADIVPRAGIGDTTTQGELKEQGFLDQCKQSLLLPDDYEIMGVYFRYWLFAWDILVEAPGLTLPKQDEELPFVVLTYQMDGHGKRTLKCIELAKHHYERLRID